MRKEIQISNIEYSMSNVEVGNAISQPSTFNLRHLIFDILPVFYFFIFHSSFFIPHFSSFGIQHSIFIIHYFASGLFCNSTSGNAKITLPGTGLRFGNLITAFTPLMVCATRLVRTISNQRFASPINS
jgi:hypothetical protein